MMEPLKTSLLLLGVLALHHATVNSQMCDRTMGMIPPKTTGSGKFEIVVNTGLERYIPGAMHTVRIRGQGDQYTTEKFSGFLLVSEPTVGSTGQVSAGTFRLKDDSLSRFSEFCPDAVKHASEVAKPEVQIFWIAPPVSAGCVNFRATVIKNSQQWYMDDDNLTKTLCPDEDEDPDDVENPEPCRACDEAKYELTFEGLWSSLSHPRHFPNYSWVANFSDIIGASHAPKFRVWEYGRNASEGLRSVAEKGLSLELERELKEQSESIRTIIKARGLKHTNFYGLKTFAVFRADKDHNLISFVSKIGPSPDWFVGVSALNLCLQNGSWLTEKEMNLYPIDAGTDSGVTYESHPPDLPTDPRQPIARIVGNSDSKSPFYSPDGNTLKPFARLRLQQQRSYKRGTCDDTSRHSGVSSEFGDDDFYDESPDRDRPECAMHQWSLWSACVPACGKGTRKKFRKYVNEPKAREFGCTRKDMIEEVCYNPQSCKGQAGSYFQEFPTGRGSSRDTLVPSYNVDNRSPYNAVPVTRAPYVPVDNRNLYNPIIETRSPYVPVDTRNTRTEDRVPSIGDPMDEPCGTTEWRPWSLCADPCGTGIRVQLRSYLRPSQARKHKCDDSKLKNTERCPRTPECRDNQPEQVEEGCEVTGWGPWQPCTQTCGRGVKTRYRVYKFPHIDHRKCTLAMQQTEPCEGILPHCPPDRTQEELAEERSEIQSKYGVVISSAYTHMMADQSKNQSHCDYSPTRTRHHSKTGMSGGSAGWNAQGHQSSYQLQPISPNNWNPGFNSHAPYASGMPNSNLQPQTPLLTTHSTNSFVMNPAGTDQWPATHSQNQHYQYQQYQQAYYNDGPPVDCKMSPWSPWSRCSAKCGRGYKYQSRYVQVFNENGGKECPKETERNRRCHGTDCPRNSAHALNPLYLRSRTSLEERK